MQYRRFMRVTIFDLSETSLYTYHNTYSLVILCMNFLLHGQDGRMLKLLEVHLREDCKANFGGNVLQG